MPDIIDRLYKLRICAYSLSIDDCAILKTDFFTIHRTC